MKISFSEDAWTEFLYWQTQDRKTIKKINELIRDIEREPYHGIGKPEALTGNWSGWWSRKINNKDRIIYRIEGDHIEIAQCKDHYEDT
jgi:toxin YoeB